MAVLGEQRAWSAHGDMASGGCQEGSCRAGAGGGMRGVQLQGGFRGSQRV